MNAQQLAQCVECGPTRATVWLPFFLEAFNLAQIDSFDRKVAFLAQVGHESGGLAFTSELWGPTPAQRGYEGRADLGNTQSGDGVRFKGHGIIQVTGRANHAAARDNLRKLCPDLAVPDFEARPEDLCQPRWACLSAAEFWIRKRCNDLADARDFYGLTRRINGGLNGMPDRVRRQALCQKVLA